MIAFLFAMGGKCWVPLPLCLPAAALFLEAEVLLLEILIFVGSYAYDRHQFLVGGGKLGIIGHQFLQNCFLGGGGVGEVVEVSL